MGFINCILSIKLPFHLSFSTLLFNGTFLACFRQMIQAAIKNTEKGAILITHYLAEAEAVCDRVAILVSGRLRWVSPQSLHLTPHVGLIPCEKGKSLWATRVLPSCPLREALSLTCGI